MTKTGDQLFVEQFYGSKVAKLHHAELMLLSPSHPVTIDQFHFLGDFNCRFFRFDVWIYGVHTTIRYHGYAGIWGDQDKRVVGLHLPNLVWHLLAIAIIGPRAILNTELRSLLKNSSNICAAPDPEKYPKCFIWERLIG